MNRGEIAVAIATLLIMAVPAFFGFNEGRKIRAEIDKCESADGMYFRDEKKCLPNGIVISLSEPAPSQ